MSNNAHDKAAQEERFADIFARLREQDIEQFYAHYQLWVLRRRLPLIEKQLEALREHLAENQRATESLRPSALALAVLVRLQSNGVSDTDVLDLMLDRGEDWLDRMMQRLDYCEQVEDFIQGDYTQWCIRSLEGAYDWIDSLLGSIKEDNGRRKSSGSADEATEELLLQKLSQDDEEAMLEVTLKQPAAPSEAAPEGNEFSDVESQPASEDERPSVPDELISTSREESEISSQSEAADENSELEPQPELIGWKDLEDLEAPGGYPMPWYSVDLTENGATSTPHDAEQAPVMDDWIKILQADNVAEIEAHATSDNVAELPLPADRVETAEIQAHVTTPAEAAEAPAEVAYIPDNTSEIPEEAETPREPETISPTDTAQEQPALTDEEGNASTSAILVDETSVTDPQRAQEVPSLDEQPMTENDKPEDTPQAVATRPDQTATTEASHDESATDATTISTKNGEAKAEPSANTRVDDKLEESELADDQQKGDLLEPQESSREDAQPLEAAAASTDKAESAATQPPANQPPQAEAQETEVTEQPTSVEPPAQTETELAEDSETQTPDPALAEIAPLAATETPMPDTEVTPTTSEQTANAEPQTEVISLSASELRESPQTQEANPAQATGHQTSGNEIETAAIANDILSVEDEQEEQLAWYEYLDLEEPANTLVQSTLEARIEPEEASAPDVTEASSPEIHEYAIAEQSADEQALALHPEGKGAEETGEIEDWQSWNTAEADEETLPLALKDIQRAQQSALSNAPEELPSVDITADAATSQPDAHSSTNTNADAQTIQTPVEANAASEEHPMSSIKGIDEQPTLSLNEIRPIPRESTPFAVEASAETGKSAQVESEPALTRFTQPERAREIAAPPTFANTAPQTYQQASGAEMVAQPRAGSPQTEQAPVVQMTKPGEEPRKKLGFWRRLFSFGRKKKR